LERLCDIFFEFSNEDRLKIMQKLREESTNVTLLAQELGITTQECSRHVARLSEARLTSKNPEGTYSLTQYGSLFLKLIRSQRFIAEQRDYFLAHSLERTPSEFVCRIGELRGSESTENVMVTNHIVESIIRSAEEYLWILHDQYFLNILPLTLEALRRGVKFRTFERLTKRPEGELDPHRPSYIEEDDEIYFMRAWQSGQVSTEFSDEIDVYLYISEKQAFIAFPSDKGGFDYLGFYSSDPSMLGYCRDFFDFHWGRGVPLTQERGDRVYELRKRYYREREQARKR
jgi:predicted transcriptional regulator